MSNERKHLPSIIVPKNGHELLKEFAKSVDLSLSEALRQLVKESPRLIEFARTKGYDIENLNVSEWGGDRKKTD